MQYHTQSNADNDDGNKIVVQVNARYHLIGQEHPTYDDGHDEPRVSEAAAQANEQPYGYHNHGPAGEPEWKFDTRLMSEPYGTDAQKENTAGDMTGLEMLWIVTVSEAIRLSGRLRFHIVVWLYRKERQQAR